MECHKIPPSFLEGPGRVWRESELHPRPLGLNPQSCPSENPVLLGLNGRLCHSPKTFVCMFWSSGTEIFPRISCPCGHLMCKEQLEWSGKRKGYPSVLIIIIINFHHQLKSPNRKSYFHLFLSFCNK